jgi:hypothetical protein
MKKLSGSILLCLVLVAGTAAVAKSKDNAREVTGCISKGDSAKEFMLTGDDGST